MKLEDGQKSQLVQGVGEKITACSTSSGLVWAAAWLPPASSRALFNVLGEEVVAVGWDRGRPGEGRVAGIYPLPLTYSLTLGAACQNSSRALAKGNMARFPGVATTGS